MVDLGLWFLAVVGGHLGHYLVAFAGKALERDAQHLVHARIRLGALKESNASVIGITHQAVKAVLAKRALHTAVVGPRTEGQSCDLHA